MLSSKQKHKETASKLKSMGTQTESAMIDLDSVPDPPKIEMSSIAVQTEPEVKSQDDGHGIGEETKMGAVIKRLSSELRTKWAECDRFKEDVDRTALELTESKKEALALRVELNECRQQMEDQQVYGWNLQKYLDDKSRNEAVLRQQVMAQQQRMEQMV